MVVIRSVNEIISNLMDFFRMAQPTLDTKTGTVARDLFIEGPASSLSLLYDEIQGVSTNNSLRLSIGSDLDSLKELLVDTPCISSYNKDKEEAGPSINK